MKKSMLAVCLIVSIICFAQPVVKKLENENKGWKLEKIAEVDLNEDLDSPLNPILYNGKIYYTNIQAKSLTILDTEGNLIKLLDSNGRGPGEFLMPSNIYIDEKKQELCVVDQMNQRTSIFDLDGNHKRDIKIENMTYAIQRKKIKDKNIESIMKVEIDQEKGSMWIKPTVMLAEKQIFQTQFSPFDSMQSGNKIPLITTLDEKVFITTGSKEKYEIDVFDLNGNLEEKFSKKVKMVKFSKEDQKKIKENIDSVLEQLPAEAKSAMNTDNYEYQAHIAAIKDDGKYLWIQNVDKDGNLFDIISKKGKLLTSIRLNNKIGFFLIDKDNIIEIIGNEDEEFKLINYKLAK